jgi:hypothetical protein
VHVLGATGRPLGPLAGDGREHVGRPLVSKMVDSISLVIRGISKE